MMRETEGSSGSSAPRNVDIIISDFLEFGAQRVAIAAANGLAQRGYYVRFVVLRAEGPFRDTLASQIPCLELLPKAVWQPPRRTQLLTAAARYRRLCGDGSERVVISFSPVTNALALFATVGRATQKCVLQEHAFQSVAIKDKSSYSPQFRLLYRFVLAPAYRFADRLVCVSDALRQDVCTTYGVPASKAITIYNPVDRELLEARAAECPGIWPDRGLLKVIAAGRMAPQKNFVRFLEVISRVRELHPDLELDVVVLGDGPERERIVKTRGDLGLTDVVALPGFAANPYPYLQAADVLCLTSEWEGLPMVIAEAMALGSVVVAHDCPSGPREMIGPDSGFLTDFGDVDALAQAIYLLREKETRAAMATAGLNRVQRLFDQRVFLDQYESMIGELWAPDGPETHLPSTE